MKFLLLPGLDGTGRLFEPFVRQAPEEAACTVARYPVDRALSYPECADLVVSEFLPDGEFVIVSESFSGPHLLLQTEPERCWQEITAFVTSNCRG